MGKTNSKKESEKKSNTALFVVLGVIVILVIAFLFWWLNRKFEVRFIYNNGTEDKTVLVKYNNLIDKADIKTDLTQKKYTFVGYYEIYYLSGEDIDKANKDSNYNPCSEGYKLYQNNTKCINDNKFDFDNTKISKKTYIEAIWSGIAFSINPTSKTINEGASFTIEATITGTDDKTVTWKSKDESIAKVSDTGKVTGVKKGKTTIVATSHGIERECVVTVNEVKKEEPKPVDKGKIKLSSNKTCIVDTDEAKVTAKLTNATNKNVTWSSSSKCYGSKKSSNTVNYFYRKGCSDSKDTTLTVTGKLANGSSSSVKIKYEPELEVTVYNNGSPIEVDDDGYYYGSYIRIETNVSSTFNGNYITSTTSTSASLSSASSTEIRIRTKCGQLKTIRVMAVIN